MDTKRFPKWLLYTGLSLLLTTSCVSRRSIAYFQDNVQSLEHQQNNNLKIKPDDLLTIRVSASEQEAALPFNLTKTIASNERVGNVELETYMVSDQGTIEFPVLGTLKVEGLTAFELSAKIREEVREYVREAIVNVRILNFQVSILGEVNNPGTFTVADDHLSLAKALGMAGDLTLFGKRNNIMVMRNENGMKTKAYLDITDMDVVNSPYYYLRQNDIVYVEPAASRMQSASTLGVARNYLSVISVLISLVILVTK